MSDFFLEGPAEDVEYRCIRDGRLEPDVAARLFVEHLWAKARPFLEPRFRQRARREFHPAFWEMYLAAMCVDTGLEIVAWGKRRDREGGPDIQVGEGTLWIEATAPGAGCGPDAVPDIPTGNFERSPDGQIKLRITNALDVKNRKYQEYLASATVRPSEPYVVAINGWAIPWGRILGDPPWIVSSVYSIGSESIVVDTESHKILEQFYRYEPEVRKESGGAVGTRAFLDEEYTGISAVVWSTANGSNPHPHLGFDFIVVHNVRATNRLPRGLLPCWREYWVEDGQLRCRERTESSPPS